VFDEAQHEVRYRLDRRRAHDVRDGWGFVKLSPRPDGKTLVSYGAVVDPGNALLIAVFGSDLRQHLLDVPKQLKRWVERHRAAARPSAP
jgi:hypothetical protein